MLGPVGLLFIFLISFPKGESILEGKDLESITHVLNPGFLFNLPEASFFFSFPNGGYNNCYLLYIT